MVETQTKVLSKTYAMVAVTVLATGATAYAAMGLLGGQRGYQNFYVQCHDGFTYEANANRTQVSEARGGGPLVWEGIACTSARELNQLAKDVCVGRTNPNTGKSGVNTYKISQRCVVQNIPSPGYGYGYGYNDAVTSNQSAKSSTKMNTKSYQQEDTKKKSMFNFWKK